MRPWTYPNFDGLLELAQRDGVDIRPIMLRVITDSYLLTEHHSLQDERQFTELALRLLDGVDVPARITMAERLVTYSQTPKAVILRLARDDIEVAASLLENAEALSEDDLLVIAKECSPAHADIVAARLGDNVKLQHVGEPAESASRGAPAKDDSTATPPAALSSAIPVESTYPAANVGTAASDLVIWEFGTNPVQRDAVRIVDPAMKELSEIFFTATEWERVLILQNLDCGMLRPASLAAPLKRSDFWKLETATLRRETDTVVRDIQRALSLSAGLARRVVDDKRGEPLIVASKAMELPAELVQRMLLFLNGSAGQSVDRIYQLSNLFSEISVSAARTMVAIWQAADPLQAKPVRQDEPTWRKVAETARRAVSEVTHPAATEPLRSSAIRKSVA